MAAHYFIFGLHAESNIEIPGFPAPSENLPVDLVFTLGSLPGWLDPVLPHNHDAWYVSPDPGENGGPSSRVWQILEGDYFRILYDDGTDCVMDKKGTHIWIQWPDNYSVKDVVPYLQGQLLGLAQRLRGVTCLHASAIVIGQRAIAIAGPKGRGKSSTAAAFLRLGFPVLADDVLPVFEDAGRFMVRPAHSRLWLCPDMVETLYGSSDALPQFAPSWEKRYLDLNAAGPGQPAGPKALAAIYVLAARANEPDRPTVHGADRHDAMLELLCNTYINHLLDPEMQSREFTLLGRLHQNVPLRVVRPHMDASRISQLCQVILDDVASRAGPARHDVSLAEA